MPCRATQEGQIMVESSDKKWSTGEGNDKRLQYSCLLMKVKVESEKVGLKLNIQKMKIVASGSIT